MDSYNDAVCIDLESDVAAVSTSSLLRYFPAEDSRSVLLTLFKSVSVIRPGTNEVVITIGGKEATVALASVGSTEFFIQLLTYGLTLSTADYEPLAKCVAICTEWISALIVERYSQLPAPIVARHEFYLDLLLKMLVEIFRLREASKQPLLCHLVLRRIEETAKENIATIRRDVWQQVLIFALRTSSIVFQSVGSGLPEFSQRAASVLVHLWLAACVSCFPPPPLWKTLASLLPKWRHSQPVVDQWGVAVVWLTSLLTTTCFPDRNLQSFMVHNANTQQSLHWAYLANSFQQKPTVLSQTWYRLLHAAGNMADLCKPSAFLLSTLPSPASSQPQPSPDQLVAFVRALPAIFHSSMYTLSCVSDLLLGIQCAQISASQLGLLSPQLAAGDGDELSISGLSSSSLPTTSTTSLPVSSNQRKSSRKVLTQKVVGRPVSMAGLMGSLTHSASSAVSSTSSVAPISTPTTSTLPSSMSMSSVSTIPGNTAATAATASMVPSTSTMSIASSASSSSSSLLQASSPQILIAISSPKNVRPALSTLLNLVGGWLIDAIYAVIAPNDSSITVEQRPRSGSAIELEGLVQQAVATATGSNEQSVQLLKLFSTGIAEALGSLCRLVGSCRRWGPFSEASKLQKIGSFVRFQQIIGLALNSGHPQLIGSILLNSSWSLFHGQVPGVTFLIPDAVSACRLSLRANLTQEQKIIHATLSITCALSSLPGSALQVVVDNLFECLVASLFLPTTTTESSTETPPMPATYSLETLQLQLASILVLLISSNLSLSTNYIVEAKTSLMSLFQIALPVICRLLVAHSTKAGSSAGSPPQGRQLCALEFLAACAPLLVRASTASPGTETAGQQLASMVMVALCHMIETECSRPPTEHSRDLHSVIVAAYSCLAIWVANCGSGICRVRSSPASGGSPAASGAMPTPLIANRDFFAQVMRVIELGLTGTMSPLGDDPMSTGTEVPKSISTGSASQALTPTTPVAILPVSRRVQLSAETLLHVVLSSPPMSGICRPFQTSCCVDEHLLDNYLQGHPSNVSALSPSPASPPPTSPSLTAEQHTYSLGDSVVATFLPTRHPEPCQLPSGGGQLNNGVLMLVRNPHGRYCWLLSTQPITTERSVSSTTTAPAISSPEAVSSGQNAHLSPTVASSNAGGAIGRRFQPPGTEFVGTVQADWNLPRSLTGSWSDSKPEAMKILLAKDAQRTQAKLTALPRGRPAEPPKPPNESRRELFLDRLLLNHLAYTKPTAGQRGRFAMLDIESPATPSLSSLIDVLSDRLSATLWCFYCKANDHASDVFLPPSDVETVSPLFWELLEAIAWPRPVVAGNNTQPQQHQTPPKPPYDATPSSGVLYWADSAIELTVFSPNINDFGQDSTSHRFHHNHPTAVVVFLEDPDTDRERVLPRLQTTLDRLYHMASITPLINPFVFVVSLTGTGAYRIFHVANLLPPVSSSRRHLSTSLFFAAAHVAPGGLVVSRKSTASFIRQAVIGQAMRTHLVLSAAAPTAASLEGTTPASRRQQRIEAFRRSTVVELSEPDLFASLFVGHPPQRQSLSAASVDITTTNAPPSSVSPPSSSSTAASRFSAGLILASG